MSLTEGQIAALLAVAAGGPVASMFPPVDPRTGRLWYPAWRTPVPTKRTPAQRGERKASRKQTQASRKTSRPRKRAHRKRG